jgi:hypothetical protein
MKWKEHRKNVFAITLLKYELQICNQTRKELPAAAGRNKSFPGFGNTPRIPSLTATGSEGDRCRGNRSSGAVPG